MVQGEATQEPDAPESALVSPPAEGAEPPRIDAQEVEAQEVDAQEVDAAGPAPTASGEDASEAAPAEEAAAPAAKMDWSHLRGFQAVEPAPETSADYAAELQKELGARSARFARSVDESIVLSSDGVLRWLGDPVARIVSGEALLQPRAVLLADEALAGEERAAVDTRAGLWLAAHLRKALAPLFALEEGAELGDAAKPLGGKIAEALGVLDRERIRNEVRSLDQTARGALRKLGVRFGSLYIYVPLLLKPGARSLCSMLWTLRRGPEPGADRLLGFAAAGRTSFANEGLLSPDAYRVAGFRLCGERVVRVDIIERLSDLIRAAIPHHMRAGSRPASEANGFLITPQMTSLTGCSGEAFASILRSLGFEAVKVNKAAFEAANAKAPTEPIKPAAAEAPSNADEAAKSEAEDAAPATADESAEPSAEELTGTLEAAPDATEPKPSEVATSEPAEEASAPAATEDRVEAFATTEASADAAAAETDADAPAIVASEAAPSSATAAVDAVEEIEIWRPALRRPRAPPRAEPAEREARAGSGRSRRRPDRPAEPKPAPAAAELVEAPAAPVRPSRPERRDEMPRRFEGRKEERPREERRPQKDFPPRRESRPADPDSPFAKLAALKPLLERRDKRP